MSTNLEQNTPVAPQPETPAQKNSEQHKESAKLAIELTKQFLTLAVGGVGFVVGLLSANADFIPRTLSVVCLIGFGVSVVCGLLFFMGSVWEINQNNNFDVFTRRLRRLANGQLFAFLIFVLLIGFFAVKRAYSGATASRQSGNYSILEIQNGTNSIRQPVFEKSKVSVVISSNQLSIDVVPQP